jgi:hypothetical protein
MHEVKLWQTCGREHIAHKNKESLSSTEMESLAYNVNKLSNSHLLWYQKPANPLQWLSLHHYLHINISYHPPHNHRVQSAEQPPLHKLQWHSLHH